MNRLSIFRKLSGGVVLLFLCLAAGAPGSSAQRAQTPRRPDPKVLLLNNYRQYPERYIRILEESWKLDRGNALHSFTLKNSAAVVYGEIEMRFSYLDPAGKTLHTRLVKVPGNLAPYQVKRIKGFKVQAVPAQSDQAVLALTKASIIQ